MLTRTLVVWTQIVLETKNLLLAHCAIRIYNTHQRWERNIPYTCWQYSTDDAREQRWRQPCFSQGCQAIDRASELNFFWYMQLSWNEWFCGTHLRLVYVTATWNESSLCRFSAINLFSQGRYLNFNQLQFYVLHALQDHATNELEHCLHQQMSFSCICEECSACRKLNLDVYWP